ncbi:hypothetical protein F2Q69_00058976 [Brassica cretica]|uniref:Uncharacterized protein n=1 Tax=Brassica cretica TaxID=69181 RepID=A0A8S9RSU9_BRACR|nr:hypothetical protein F2Q69_00058976 [Brassica cretica]
MEEMRQDITKTQPAADRHRPTSVDNRLPASVDDNLPHSHPMKSQPYFHTRAEIDQFVGEIYGIIETKEERLDRRCDDIYFPMDLSTNALTSKIEAIQREIIEIHGYIARRPEASASIDRPNNKSTDIHRQTSVDEATNRGRQVPKVTSDMSDTHNHGEEISGDTYATLMRHQFNLESLGDKLQNIEDTTAIMKENGAEEMKQCETSLEPKLTSNLIELNSACLGLGIHGIGFFKQVWKQRFSRIFSRLERRSKEIYD